MIRNRRSKRAVLVSAALVAGIVFASPEAQGQVKAFKISGKGIIDLIPLVPGGKGNHNIKGNATHLGRHDGAGTAEIITVNPDFTGTFKSAKPFIFVAANGDRLAFHYGNTEYGAKQDGQVTILPADGGKFKTVWVAEFVPFREQSTGRFKRVYAGSVIMIAETAAFDITNPTNVEYSWRGEGRIAFAKKRK